MWVVVCIKKDGGVGEVFAGFHSRAEAETWANAALEKMHLAEALVKFTREKIDLF